MALTIPPGWKKVLDENGTLDASKISGIIDASKISNLDATKITSGSFDPARIPNLPANKITSGEIDIARIPTITDAKISGLSASKITGTLTADRFADNTITSSKISGTIASAKIGTLTATNFADNTITSAKISGTIEAAKIGTLTTTNLADNSITSPKIADNAISNSKLATGLDLGKFTEGTLLKSRMPSLTTVDVILEQITTTFPSSPVKGMQVMLDNQVYIYTGI